MRVWPLIAIMVIAGAIVLWPQPPQEPTPLERGLEQLHASGADDAHALEAVLAAGQDPRAWYGSNLLATVTVPPPTQDPIEGLYEINVVLQAGIDATAWQDPVHGTQDLQARLLDNVDAALAADNDAVQSFQLLAMSNAGLGDATVVADLRGVLLASQHEDGSWGCGPWVGPECTSYALRALAATGGIPDTPRNAAISYIESRLEGSAYSDPLNGVDLQITANAIRGLVAAGASVPAHVIEDLLAQQQDGMWSKSGQLSRWATAEVLVALAEAGVR